MWRLISAFSFLLCAQAVHILQSNSLGDIVEIRDRPYFIHNPENRVEDYILITSIVVPEPTWPLSGRTLSRILESYSAVDDVWNEGFIEGLAITTSGTRETLFDESAIQWLKQRAISKLFLSQHQHSRLQGFTIGSLPEPLSAGPYAYLKSSGSFYDIYRLFPDKYESFMVGCIPGNRGEEETSWIPTHFTFAPLLVDADDEEAENTAQYQHIPVPSRLRHITFSPDGYPIPNPLSLIGRRMGVKDMFHMRGLPTSAGSKAFLEMTGPSSSTTASSIANLLALGMVPVGKTRTSQFAHGASPWEFLDYSYSWNPRGDGLLSVAASSSGSGSAIAAYEWLDITVGSDTRGSVRKPASLVGVYGIRPSFGSVPLDGVVPLSEEMDTVGIFARDPELFYAVSKGLYRDSSVSQGSEFPRFPSRLLYPVDHFRALSPEVQVIYNTFFVALADSLNVTTNPLNLTHSLSHLFPNGDFSAFQSLSNRLSEYHSWNQIGRPLTEWYQTRYGQQPPLDPMPDVMFVKGQQYTPDDYDEAVAYKRRFTTLLGQTLFPSDAESCSNAILVYDAGTGGKPSYRIEDFNGLEGATEVTLVKENAKATLQENLHYLASMGGLVDVTVPLDEIGYFSHVTREWEPIPVTVQLVTRRGCDGVILDLVKVLNERNVLKGVGTGRSISLFS